MISAAVSKLGKTSLYIIEQGVRIDSEYYCSSLLSQLIPDMNALSPNEDYIFQQDGARSHTSKYAMRYLDDNLPQDAQLLLPEDWPPHSPDLNPMDYGIWSSLATKVCVKIRDVEHLCQRLAVAWEQITQDEVDRTIDSFRRRVKACVKANGRRFEYKLKRSRGQNR